MNRKKIRQITFWGILSLLYSCSDSSDDQTITIYQNIVTFAGNGPVTANFSYQKINDSPTVTLGVRGSLNDERVSEGTRLLMTYSLPDDAIYGEDCFDVRLRGLQTIYTDTVAPLPYSEIETLIKPIHLLTIYRTGEYINFTALMPELSGRRYILRADKETLSDDTVRTYLTTTVDEDKPSFNSTQTGSVDISPLWQLPEIKAVAIEVDNSNNPNRKKFTFVKDDKNGV